MQDAIKALYQAHSNPRLWAHVEDVANESERLAKRFGLDESRCGLAGYCHDLGGILSPGDQLEIARRMHWWLDPAEEAHPFILHQRFGAILAREALHIDDADVLSAIGCHTTLKAQASAMDLLIFLADKLAWDQPDAPPHGPAVRRALEVSLHHAARVYIDAAWPTLRTPHTWLIQAREWLAKEDQLHGRP